MPRRWRWAIFLGNLVYVAIGWPLTPVDRLGCLTIGFATWPFGDFMEPGLRGVARASGNQKVASFLGCSAVTWSLLGATAVGAVGVGAMSYGYYVFLRWVFCSIGVYFLITQRVSSVQRWTLGLLTAVHNPIWTVQLPKQGWILLNGLALAALWSLHLAPKVGSRRRNP